MKKTCITVITILTILNFSTIVHAVDSEITENQNGNNQNLEQRRIELRQK